MGTGILERHVAQDGPVLEISDDLLSDSPQRLRVLYLERRDGSYGMRTATTMRCIFGVIFCRSNLWRGTL